MSEQLRMMNPDRSHVAELLHLYPEMTEAEARALVEKSGADLEAWTRGDRWMSDKALSEALGADDE